MNWLEKAKSLAGQNNGQYGSGLTPHDAQEVQAYALLSIAESLNKLVRDGVGIKTDDEIKIYVSNMGETL